MPYCKILLIDEDEGLRRFLSDCFADDGMMCAAFPDISSVAVNTAAECHAAIVSGAVIREKPTVSVSWLRSGHNIPIIVTVSADMESQRVALLSLGVDDVLRKPFDAAELILKTKAILRRGGVLGQVKRKPAVQYRGLSVDLLAYTVTADGVKLSLSPKELELLYLLMCNPNRICERSEIYSKVWGKILPDNRTLNLCTSRLKKKLGAYSACIVSARGVGYGFFENLNG